MPTVLHIFVDSMVKYPELLEFPNGVQNLMSIFYQDIHIDLATLVKLCRTFSDCFNIINTTFLKGFTGFIQMMSDENEEPYTEYLQPLFMTMMAALKQGLQSAGVTDEVRRELVSTVKEFFARVSGVAMYITGSKIDQIMKNFYVFFARMRVQFNIHDDPTGFHQE